MKVNRNCPLCGNRLVLGPADGLDIIYCEESVEIPSQGGYSKRKNHYIEDKDNQEVVQFLLPYKVTTTAYTNAENFSKIGFMSTYKSGKVYFKTIAKIPALHPDTEENIRKRIKTVAVFS